METSQTVICGVCDSQHISKPADYWCPECEEGLCSSCQNHHKVSRGTRHHNVISIDDFSKLPSSVVTITHCCKDHGLRYQIYCRNHDILCCPSCISSTHKECKELMALDDITKTSHMSSLLENMEETLHSIRGNINKLIKNRYENLTLIEEQRKMHIDKVNQIRNRVITLFDSLTQNMLKEINIAEENAKYKIGSALNSLTEKSRIIEGLVKDISAVKQYASPLQTIMVGKHIEGEISKEENYMNTLSGDKTFHQIQLICTIDDMMTDILLSVSSLGSVTTETSPLSLILTTEKEKQAQIVTAAKPCKPTVKDLELNLTSMFEILKGKQSLIDIRCCSRFSNSKIIVADFKNKMLIILEDDKIQNKISCPFSALNEVTVVDDKTVAVSGKVGVHIVNIETMKIKKEVKTGGSCEGIIYDKGSLWCFVHGIGIQRIQLQTDNITTVVKQGEWPGWSCITLYCGNIYQTISNSDIVICYNTKGEKLWVFKDTSVLSWPDGIAVDNSGNVYIASCNNHSVVVLSSDGKRSKQLLCRKDGLWRPFGINIDVYNMKLIVLNRNGQAFVYSIHLS